MDKNRHGKAVQVRAWHDLSYGRVNRLGKIPAGDEAVIFDVCGAGFAFT